MNSRWFCVVLASLVACGDSMSQSGTGGQGGGELCQCRISFQGSEATLKCSTQACVGGETFSCDSSAEIEKLGSCQSGTGGGAGGGNGSTGGGNSSNGGGNSSTGGGKSSSGGGNNATGGGNSSTGGGSASTGGGSSSTGGGSSSTGGGSANQWEQRLVSTTSNLTAITVDGLTSKKIFVVGSDGFCAQVPQALGLAITPCNIPNSSGKNFTAVKYVEAGDRLLVGADDGSEWIRDALPGESPAWRDGPKASSAIRGIGIWVRYSYEVGDSGLARLVDTTSRPPTTASMTGVPPGAQLNAVDVVANSFTEKGWIVGGAGVILAFDTFKSGKAVQVESSPSSETLNAVLIRGDAGDIDEVIAVGNKGTILSRSAAGEWTVQTTSVTADLFGVFPGPSGSLLAVGAQGTILRRTLTSTTWVTEKSGVSSTLRAGAKVLGNVTTYFVVGDGAVLLTRK